MTNHWIDLKNADVILAMGGNPASNHPISMKWIMRAREKGAKLICVDPRFSQTAAKADLYAPLRRRISPSSGDDQLPSWQTISTSRITSSTTPTPRL